MPAVRPKSLVLDLLRVAESRAVPVRAFVAIGELFGLSGNAVRVALTRLVADGRVESDERGSYRLSGDVIALAAHVESWRSGEGRVRAWDGDWRAIVLPNALERAERTRSLRALERLGFRRGFGQLWLRPDNLAPPFAETLETLAALGLARRAQSFVARDFEPDELERWTRRAWRTERFARQQNELSERLDKSLERLPRMSTPAAARETFLLGGAAIRLLAADPLLPAELCDPSARVRLTETMLGYDVVGRSVWRDLVGSVELGRAPAHLGAEAA